MILGLRAPGKQRSVTEGLAAVLAAARPPEAQRSPAASPRSPAVPGRALPPHPHSRPAPRPAGCRAWGAAHLPKAKREKTGLRDLRLAELEVGGDANRGRRDCTRQAGVAFPRQETFLNNFVKCILLIKT